MVASSHDTVDSTSDGMPRDDLLRVLLDEERLAILGTLARGRVTVDELAAQVAMKRSALTKHLAQLLATGLVERDGENRVQLAVARIRELKRELFARPAAQWPQDSDAQVLDAFIRDGVVHHVPVQWRKRKVVLAWLVTRFEMGRDYSEPEVNDLLRGHGEDYAALRRYLVDAGFLARAAGIYRRAEPPAELGE